MNPQCIPVRQHSRRPLLLSRAGYSCMSSSLLRLCRRSLLSSEKMAVRTWIGWMTVVPNNARPIVSLNFVRSIRHLCEASIQRDMDVECRCGIATLLRWDWTIKRYCTSRDEAKVWHLALAATNMLRLLLLFITSRSTSPFHSVPFRGYLPHAGCFCCFAP